MVFLPPRSSKSLICSKLFPAWYLGRHPNHEILSVSHSDQLASDFGRSVRDVVNDQDYQSIFEGVKLRSDVRAAGKWQTNKNGVYVAAGVRTQIAGQRKMHLVKRVVATLKNGIQLVYEQDLCRMVLLLLLIHDITRMIFVVGYYQVKVTVPIKL